MTTKDLIKKRLYGISDDNANRLELFITNHSNFTDKEKEELLDIISGCMVGHLIKHGNVSMTDLDDSVWAAHNGTGVFAKK